MFLPSEGIKLRGGAPVIDVRIDDFIELMKHPVLIFKI
jgi:hypothetical protein